MSKRNTTRLNPRHQDMVRAKIQASVIINRLQKHIAGKVDMSASQVTAARILLDKTLPNLQATELTGQDGGPVQVNILDPTRRPAE